MKLSLFNRGDDNEETVELDDDALVGQLREVVNSNPDLTMEEALRRGIQHVVDNGAPTGGTSAG
jgi:hypothetical protein